jgi:hypothetical protein
MLIDTIRMVKITSHFDTHVFGVSFILPANNKEQIYRNIDVMLY